MKHEILTRGTVLMFDLDPVVGHEQAKLRPCVVISHPLREKGLSELVVVLPITSRYRELPWLIPVLPPEGGLKKSSFIMSNQPRTISLLRRKSEVLGVLSENTMKRVDELLRYLLDL